MPLPEDRSGTLEHTLNKVYADTMLELNVVRSFTEDAVKRLVSQKTALDEHAQILSDHTTRLDRIETMLAQILTHLKEKSSALPDAHRRSDTEPEQPEPVQQRRERTFWERMMGIYPDEVEPEKP